MRQVLDTFKLLERTTMKPITWQLVEAKTNSPPFSVTAIAEDEDVAAEQENEFMHGMSELKSGRMPSVWSDDDSRAIVDDLLARFSRGATVEFTTANHSAIRLEVQDAPNFEQAVNQPSFDPARTKHQMGSIEGTLASVDFYYRKPAIRLVERKTLASIPCELTPELAKDFQSERIAAVWNHRRVMVRGLIYYNKTGRVLRVVATEARLIDPREVSLEEIQDASFTGGLSSLEYLSTLRDGDRS